jgi:hypothetical protein
MSSVLTDMDLIAQSCVYSTSHGDPSRPGHQHVATAGILTLKMAIAPTIMAAATTSTKPVPTCDMPPCSGRIFGRSTDLERHKDSIHGCDQCVFWCPGPDCHRSQTVGEKPYKGRKDKLYEHIKRVHGDKRGLWPAWHKEIDDVAEENRRAHVRGEH